MELFTSSSDVSFLGSEAEQRVVLFCVCGHLFAPRHPVLLHRPFPTLLSRRLPGRAWPPALLLPVCLQHQAALTTQLRESLPVMAFPGPSLCTTSDLLLTLCIRLVFSQTGTARAGPGTCFQAPSSLTFPTVVLDFGHPGRYFQRPDSKSDPVVGALCM